MEISIVVETMKRWQIDVAMMWLIHDLKKASTKPNIWAYRLSQPQNRVRHQGLQEYVQQPPTCQGMRFARTAVPTCLCPRAYVSAISGRTHRLPRTVSYGEVNIDRSRMFERRLRHGSSRQLLIACRPQPAFGLDMATSAHPSKPASARLFESVKVKANSIECPCWCTRSARVA